MSAYRHKTVNESDTEFAERKKSSAAPLREASSVAPIYGKSSTAPISAASSVAPLREASSKAPIHEKSSVAPINVASSVAPIHGNSSVAPIKMTSYAGPIHQASSVKMNPSSTTTVSTNNTTSAVHISPSTYRSNAQIVPSAKSSTYTGTTLDEYGGDVHHLSSKIDLEPSRPLVTFNTPVGNGSDFEIGENPSQFYLYVTIVIIIILMLVAGAILIRQ